MKMDDLTDLLHGPAAPASPEVFQQLGAITRLLHDTMQQLGVMPKLQVAADGIPDARSRLSYIASKTAAAADKVLNSVDQAKAEHADTAGHLCSVQHEFPAFAATGLFRRGHRRCGYSPAAPGDAA